MKTACPKYILPVLSRPALTLLLCLVAVCCRPPGVQASTLSWSGDGGTDANWNNIANWGYSGTPANGDTLVFPAGQPNLANTNNLVSLTVSQIRFVGAGAAMRFGATRSR